MEDNANPNSTKKKSHRERHSGRKAEKKKFKDTKNAAAQELSDKQRNPKAFAINSAVRAERKFRRRQDIDTKKQHIPLVDRTPLEPPPILIAVVGPPKVGKTTVINNLIKLFTKSPLTDIKGPVTIVTGKKRRITLIECNNDINCMIDLAKVADLVLLLCDASFGFEMEIFEFLNICQVHGMPRIMGVLTHLDLIKNSKTLKNTKKTLKHRFWTEVYPGAKLFYLSGKVREEYLKNEIKNLGRFISVMKFRPLTWRSTHSYMLVDRYEDLTSQGLVHKNQKCDRTISLYGYIRGVPLKKESSVHIAGVGDVKIRDLSFLPDPCPLPDQIKKRALVEKEKCIYAPFSGVGGIVYDKDAVYVELGGSHSYKDRNVDSEKNNIVSNLIETRETLDVKMAHSKLQIFTGGQELTSKDYEKINEDDSEEEFEEESDLEDSEEETQSDELNKKKSKKQKNVKLIANEDEDSSDEDESKNEISKKPISNKSKHKENKDKSDELLEELEVLRKKSYKEEKIEDSGRIRRKVIFEDVDQSFDEQTDSDNEDSVDEIVDEKQIDQTTKRDKNDVYDKVTNVLKNLEQKKVIQKPYQENEFEDLSENDEDDDDENDDESISNEDEGLENDDEDMEIEEKSERSSDSENEEDNMGVKWKENLARKAQDAFFERQSSTQNLMKLVYGVFEVKAKNKKEDNSLENENEIDDLLKKVSSQQQKVIMDKESLNSEESTLMQPWNTKMRDWTEYETKSLLLNCFVTGKWKDSEDANELLKLDDAEDLNEDSDDFGDFEDLETGEKHSSQPKVEKRKREGDEKDEVTDKKLLAEKKRKLKEKFDSEYDNGEKNTYYDELKLTAENQAKLNKSCFENMPDDVRTQIEGFRAGMYVRMEFENVPSEFITNFDPTYPVVIGSLNIGEENIGFVNIKIKKHRWYSKILKTSDPLIISLGWRRFQTIPLFSKLEDDLKFRYLKYTPEHVGCNAHFWGPITPQGTGFLALQNVESNPEILKSQGFRIAATGAVQELDKSTQIMKKLKLIGYPLKIYKKTAFIKDMFNSSLEVAKFEGAKIKTVSGIRGQIKKPIAKPEGCFRATFEDKIKLSDIVFCRTWYKVDVPQFYNPITNLLLPLNEKNCWKGARTKGEIKREKNIKVIANPDHLYEPIVREEKPFAPLNIPKKLQEALPYRDKPKHGIKFSEKKKGTPRVAVILEPKEQKISNMMKMIKTTYQNKQEKLQQETKERLEKHRQVILAQEASKQKDIKKKKKEVMRVRSKKDLSKKKD